MSQSDPVCTSDLRLAAAFLFCALAAVVGSRAQAVAANPDGGIEVRGESRYVGGSLANVRSGPLESAPIVARLPINTPLVVQEQIRSWCRIASEKTPYAAPAQGYMACSLVRPVPATLDEIKSELARSGAYRPFTLDTLAGATLTRLPLSTIRARLQAVSRSFFLAPNERDFFEYAGLLELELLNSGPAGEDVMIDGRPQTVPRNAVFEVMKTYMRAGLAVAVADTQPRPDSDSSKAPNFNPEELKEYGGFTLPRVKPSLFRSRADIAGMAGHPFAVRQRDRLGGSLDLVWAAQDTHLRPHLDERRGVKREWMFRPRYVSRHNGVVGAWDIDVSAIRFKDLPGWALSETGSVSGALLQENIPPADSCGSPARTLFRVDKPVQRPLAFIVTPADIDPAKIVITRLPRGGKGENGRAVRFAAAMDLNEDKIPDLLIVHLQEDEDGGMRAGKRALVKGFQISAVLYANISGTWQRLHWVSEHFCT